MKLLLLFLAMSAGWVCMAPDAYATQPDRFRLDPSPPDYLGPASVTTPVTPPLPAPPCMLCQPSLRQKGVSIDALTDPKAWGKVFVRNVDSTYRTPQNLHDLTLGRSYARPNR